MEDFSKFGVSPVPTDSKEILKRNCFLCDVGSVKFLVPHGSLEAFVFMCIRSGNDVAIRYQDSDLVI